MTDRLALLRQLADRSPGDPFSHYGLAMELRRLERADEACAVFGELLLGHPDYVPTYLMFGNLLRQLGRNEQAAVVFDRGVDAARAVGNEHAAAELAAARAELP